MKTFALIFIILSLSGCQSKDARDKKLKEQCIVAAEEYAASRIDNSRKEMAGVGVFTVGNDNRKYVIDPSKIRTGDLNDDGKDDAIVTLDTFSGQYQMVSEQVILINYKGKPVLNRAIESDMTILAIEKGLIVADVPEHARNSPLFNCSSCREIVRYRFVNGDLIRSE